MALIFISHADEDKDVARQVAEALRAQGLEPWLDEEGIRSGDTLLSLIAEVLDRADHVLVLLSQVALTKRWVLHEMRMAAAREIESGRPRVSVLKLDDCPMPTELRHKLHLDCAQDISAALGQLGAHLGDAEAMRPVPKQTVLAEMFETADDKLWDRLRKGDDWDRHDVAHALRSLSADGVEAAVAVGHNFPGNVYKQYEDTILRNIASATKASPGKCRRLLKQLEAAFFLEPADDLDYRDARDMAWCCNDLLVIVTRAARRSGLFAKLPPPHPETLSQLLAFEGDITVHGEGWYGYSFADPQATTLFGDVACSAILLQHKPDARSWGIVPGEPMTCLSVPEWKATTEVTGDAFSLLRGSSFFHNITLAEFDDIGLLDPAPP